MSLHAQFVEEHGYTRADIIHARTHDTPETRRQTTLAHRTRTTGRTCPTCGYPLDGAHPNRRYCSLKCSGDTHTDPTKWDQRRPTQLTIEGVA